MTIPAPRPDRTCLVTGASSGIGVEIARQLARRGHGVTVVARSGDKLARLADELHDQYRVRAEYLAVDLSDAAARSGLPQALAERGLGVDVLVNNAGFSTTGPVYQADPQAELTMVRTNVEAVVHLCTLFLPAMVERRVPVVTAAKERQGVRSCPTAATEATAPNQAAQATEAPGAAAQFKVPMV